jgi:hypothetical protein
VRWDIEPTMWEEDRSTDRVCVRVCVRSGESFFFYQTYYFCRLDFGAMVGGSDRFQQWMMDQSINQSSFCCWSRVDVGASWWVSK